MPHTAAPICDRRHLANGAYSAVNYVDSQLNSLCGTCKGVTGVAGVEDASCRIDSHGFPRLLSQPHSSMPKDSVSLIGMGPIEYDRPGGMKLLV